MTKGLIHFCPFVTTTLAPNLAPMTLPKAITSPNSQIGSPAMIKNNKAPMLEVKFRTLVFAVASTRERLAKTTKQTVKTVSYTHLTLPTNREV